MPVKILVLNAGSSSEKSRLYELGDSLPDRAPTPLWEADADWSERREKQKSTLRMLMHDFKRRTANRCTT